MSRLTDAAARPKNMLRSAAGLSVMSQGLSSATNAIVSVLGSIVLSENNFGALAAAMIAYRLTLLVNRSIVSNIVVIRMPRILGDLRRGFLVGSLSTSVIIGVVATAAVGIVSLLIGSAETLQNDLRILAIGMVGLVVHETLRSQAFALKRPAVAVAGDGVWLGSTLILLSTYLVWPALSLSVHLLASWVAGAVLGAAAMGIDLHRAERLRTVMHQMRRFVRTERRAGAAFMTHSFIDVGAAEVVNGVIVGAVGLGSLGRWTAANVAFSPVVPIERGAMQWAVPHRDELAADESPQSLYVAFRQLAIRLAALAAVLCAALSVVVVIAAPYAPDGSVWRSIGALLPAAVAITVIRAAKAPFSQILQILGSYRSLVRTQIIDSLTLLATIAAAAQFTIVHVAYALAIQNLLLLAIWAQRARAVTAA